MRGNRICNFKNSMQAKSRSGWLHWKFLPNTQKEEPTLSFSNSPKRLKRQDCSKPSVKPPSPWDNEAKIPPKRKLQVSIFDEYICRNPQENISKSSLAIQKKGSYTMIKSDSFRASRLTWHTQINQCNKPYQWKKSQKPHDNLKEMQKKPLIKFNIHYDLKFYQRVIEGTYLA